MKQKKLLALLLAVCMVLAVLPSFASAETIEVKDTLDKTLIGVDGTTYKTWAGITSESNAIYAGQSAGGNDSIQLRSSNNNSGIVTTGSGGTVQTVAVEWNSNTADGRTLNVYGKSTAYSAATDLYGNNAGTLIGTIVKGTSTELAITDEYEYIGLRSASGAMYLTSIEITWSADSETPPPTLYTVSFDANGGTGTMADVTTASPYTLPNCAFTAPEGQEFDYILEGTLRFSHDGRIMDLSPGDSVYYDSGKPHGMYATSKSGCKFIAVVMRGAEK